MAKNYSQIYESVYTTGNSMSFGNTMLRGNGIPLDITEVYDAYGKAVKYAATNAVAYEGQILAVTENGDTTVYVITPKKQGKYSYTENEVATEYDVFIKPIGIIPTGDNKSIEVSAEGAISLLGAAGAANGTLPMIDESGKLTWKTLEDIGAGDGNDNTTYNFTAIKKEDSEEIIGFEVQPLFNGQPIKENPEDENSEEIKYSFVFDVYTKSEVDAIIGAPSKPETSEGANDGVEATGLYIEIEKKADKTYVDDEISGLEDAISKLNHFTTKIVGSTAEVTETGILYLIKSKDVEGKDNYDEYLYIEGQGAVLIGDTSTDLSDYYNKNEVNELIDNIVDENTTYALGVSESGDDGMAVINLLDGKTGDLVDSKQITYSTSTIDKKMYEGGYTTKDKETGNIISHTSNITGEDKDRARLISPDEMAKLAALVLDEDGSVGVSGTISADNVTGLENKIVSVVTGEIKEGSNALGVEKGAQVNKIEEIIPKSDAKIKITKSTETGKEKTVIVDDSALVALITTAQTKADEANALADTAKTLANEAKLKAETNAGDIKNITDNYVSKTGLNNALATYLKAEDIEKTYLTQTAASETYLKKNDASNTYLNITTAESTYATKTSVETLGGTVTNLQEAVNNKAEANNVYTKAQIGTLAKDGEGKDKTIVQMIEDATYDDTAIKVSIKANNDAITAIYKAGDGEIPASGILADEIVRATAAEQANAKAISDLASEIGNITNIMNFRGVVTDLPSLEGEHGYNIGDVIIKGNQEYVLAETTKDEVKKLEWIAFGDASAEAAEISALTQRVATAEEEIDDLQDIAIGIGGVSEPATIIEAINAKIAAATPLATIVEAEGVKTATKGLILPEVNKFEMTEGKVTKVSTDLLANGSMTLVLNGGSANTSSAQ